MKFESLTPSLKEQFLLDFMNADKDVLKALENQRALDTWIHIRGERVKLQLCN